ncbi:MAG: hypothetical protein OXFUSZZB_002771 [Candidatus Fervidibacter sp.]|jgi:uncharacterized protein (DUF433 family)
MMARSISKRKKVTAMKRREYGRYIVSDPKVCRGALTFKGTRILVSVVLDMVARGMSWDEICREFHNHISKEHIAEAVKLAKDALMRQVNRRRVAVTKVGSAR